MSVDIRELNKNMPKKGSFKPVKWIIAGLAALIVAANSFTIVPAGYTGVVLTLGEVSKTSYDSGFHLKIPFVQTVETMSNKIQVYETPAPAVSKDLQTVSSSIAVNYRLVSDKSPDMYKNVGIDYQTILIAPVVQECMKSATAKYNAEQLITERESVSNEVKTALDSKLNSYGIYIEKFNIVNFDFSAEFNTAIEAKQVAEAQAQADANKLLEESLSNKVIAYEQIQKWDGVMPKVTGKDGGLLIDVNIDDKAAPSGQND